LHPARGHPWIVTTFPYESAFQPTANTLYTPEPGWLPPQKSLVRTLWPFLWSTHADQTPVRAHTECTRPHSPPTPRGQPHRRRSGPGLRRPDPHRTQRPPLHRRTLRRTGGDRTVRDRLRGPTFDHDRGRTGRRPGRRGRRRRGPTLRALPPSTLRLLPHHPRHRAHTRRPGSRTRARPAPPPLRCDRTRPAAEAALCSPIPGSGTRRNQNHHRAPPRPRPQ